VKHKLRLAVASPFLDKRNGTERIVIEWLSHLPGAFEIHVYSQRVEDIDISRITWHRIPKLPGPHLINFLWWFAANHLWRSFDRWFHNLTYDLVYSPGANCLDADAISVHIVFADYVQKSEPVLRLSLASVRTWPRLLHRKLYYKVVMFLERRTYTRAGTSLILIARKTGLQLERFYGCGRDSPVIYLGVDHKTFSPENRLARREHVREALGFSGSQFVLLLVGNDWRNKGVPVLLEALAQLSGLPIDLIVVSREESAEARSQVLRMGLASRVHFLPPRKDVEFYYAAADAYAGPSLEDTFALPPAEAMACGLPVVVSAANGVSEIITHGVSGLILVDPRDAVGLSAMVRRLYEDVPLRTSLGEKAAETTRQYTWERNGRELAAIFEDISRRKVRLVAQGLEHER
jgi:glycosyltransferase involved in cell wall biosynthesis